MAEAKRVVIHEDDVGMSHGANTRLRRAVEARELQLRLGDGALPVVPRGGRDRDGRPGARPRRPSDADERADPLPLAAADRAALLGRPHRRARLLLARRPERPQGRPGGGREAELRAQIDTALAAGIDVDPSRRPHGHGADAGIHRDLPPARHGLRPAGAAGEGPQALQPGELRRPARLCPLRRRRSPKRARPASRSSRSSSRPRGAARPTPRPPTARSSPRSGRGCTFLSMHFNAPGDFETINPKDAWVRTEEYALFQGAEDRRVGRGVRHRGDRHARDQGRAPGSAPVTRPASSE